MNLANCTPPVVYLFFFDNYFKLDKWDRPEAIIKVIELN